jgi:hypothetical protein
MDELTRAYYEEKYTSTYLKFKGNEFQDFFASLMGKCFPGDFQRVRPWGNSGDKKNDGYLRSKRKLFQVYAPNEMDEAKALVKIDEDFSGALPYWQDYFDEWVFVHNSFIGLGPGITKKLLSLADQNKPLRVLPWGYEELRQELFHLTDSNIASLLGPAPTQRNFSNVRFGELRKVVMTIARQNPSPSQNIRPVPADKLSANALSQSVQILLAAGMRKADLVNSFFQSWYDPRLGDQIAETFKQKYNALRNENLPPDLIFTKLRWFAGGEQQDGPDHDVAVLAVLAYFFEQCDIFEAPLKV